MKDAPALLAQRRSTVLALLTLTGAALGGCSVLSDRSGSPSGISALAVDTSAARRKISDYRRTRGLNELSLDPVLQRVAQHQAEAMARANRLSHEVAGPLPDRLAAEMVSHSAAAENVSAGYGSFERALVGWQHSPLHDANLLFKPIRRMGIAAASAPNTRYKTFWALVMTD